MPSTKSTSIEAKWYVLQSSAGQESKAITLLEKSLREHGLEHLVLETFVPTETVTYKRGKSESKKSVSYFPGYVLVKMMLTDELWHLLKNVSKISGFIGRNQKTPQVVSNAEIELIRKQIEEGKKQAQIDSTYQVGETVIIAEGPFMDFKGVIENIDFEKNKLTLMVSIFGRTTPLDVDIDQIIPVTET